MTNNQTENSSKKTIAFAVEVSSNNDLYPVERIATLVKMFNDEKILIFIKQPSELALKKLAATGIEPISYRDQKQLLQYISKLKPDLLVRDGINTELEDTEKLKEVVPALVHFDDFGEGGKAADCVLHTLYREIREKVDPHYLTGPSSFVVPETIAAITTIEDEGERPHIVVAYEGSDPENLTYRTMRHLMQLQVPVRISVLVDPSYAHDIDELKMMALSRRNITVIHADDMLETLLSQAQIVICAASYTPYKVAVIGIPCIVISQSETEIMHAFPRDQNGFIQLGSGRKLKQSHLQNAVMELLLHEARRDRAIRNQKKLDLQSNNHYIHSMLTNFAHRTPKAQAFLVQDHTKKTPRMIQ